MKSGSRGAGLREEGGGGLLLRRSAVLIHPWGGGGGGGAASEPWPVSDLSDMEGNVLQPLQVVLGRQPIQQLLRDAADALVGIARPLQQHRDDHVHGPAHGRLFQAPAEVYQRLEDVAGGLVHLHEGGGGVRQGTGTWGVGNTVVVALSRGGPRRTSPFGGQAALPCCPQSPSAKGDVDGSGGPLFLWLCLCVRV